jgi:PelA/Pel-15E family pectate lyase
MKRHFAFAALAIAAPAGAGLAEVIGHMTTAEPVTEARISRLPKAEQAAWLAYLARSRASLAADKAALAAERGGGPVPAAPAPGPSGGAGMPLDRPAEWYAGAEARHVADTVLSFQTPAGGWGKNVDRSGPARLRGQHYVPVEHLPAFAKGDIQADESWNYVGTIDNNATTSELRFLARVQAALPGKEGDAYRAALLKGLRYLLAAQYPNGGWPQVYPLQGGYHDALTYNDGAFAQVAELLSEAGRRRGDYGSVRADIAAAATSAADRAVKLVLKTQVMVGGRRAVWGQQHDALTLEPVGARNFEPAALSSDESGDLLIFLMHQPRTLQIEAAVRDGAEWLRAHTVRDVAWKKGEASEGRRLVAAPGAGPLWSRFYDITSFKPVFGDRDKSIHDDVNELSAERRNGYSWYNNGPARALRVYEQWKAQR